MRWDTKIVGVVSSRAPALALSFAKGEVVEYAATTAIADGVACRRPDTSALEVVRAGVERFVEVEDEEVEDAMRACFTDTHNVAEGAGAIGLAALLKTAAGAGPESARCCAVGTWTATSSRAFWAKAEHFGKALSDATGTRLTFDCCGRPK